MPGDGTDDPRRSGSRGDGFRMTLTLDHSVCTLYCEHSKTRCDRSRSFMAALLKRYPKDPAPLGGYCAFCGDAIERKGQRCDVSPNTFCTRRYWAAVEWHFVGCPCCPSHHADKDLDLADHGNHDGDGRASLSPRCPFFGSVLDVEFHAKSVHRWTPSL